MRERGQIIRGMLLWTGITLFGIGAFAAATLNAGPVTSASCSGAKISKRLPPLPKRKKSRC